MDREKLQRLGWTVPHLRSLVVVDASGRTTDALGSADARLSTGKVERAVRVLDRIGTSLSLGPIVSVGATAHGASALVLATDRDRVIGFFGGEVKDVEPVLANIAEQLA